MKKRPIQKRFSKNLKDFRELELKPRGEFKSKLFQQIEKANTQLKTNKSILVNTFQKKSVSFHEVYSLPQETYNLTGYLRGRVSKIVKPSSFTVLKNPSFDFLNFKKFEIYLTNLRGFKKPFSFNEEGLIRIHKIKSNDIYGLKNISKENSCSFHFNKCNEFQKEFSKFKALREIQISEKSHFLRRNFLKYIQTRKTRKNGVFSRTSNVNAVQKSQSFFNLPVSSWVPSQILSFLPFVNAKKPVLQNSKKQRSFASKHGVQTPVYNFKLSFKKGWLYITKKPFFILKKKTNIVEPGKKILDDIYFNEKHITNLINFKLTKIRNNCSRHGICNTFNGSCT
jgi:hypothetical protein